MSTVFSHRDNSSQIHHLAGGKAGKGKYAMAANVESMFYVRKKFWHGLGTMVAEAPDSTAALRLAGLDWNVIQKDIMTVDGRTTISGFKANVRDTDGSVHGIVTDRYGVVQNAEVIQTDEAENKADEDF